MGFVKAPFIFHPESILEVPFRFRPLEDMITRIDEVTGLSRRGTEILLAEIGWGDAAIS